MTQIVESDAPLTREQKRSLALLLVRKAGDIVENWQEEGADSEFATVSAAAAARQLTIWLKGLPGPDWDTRLPLPSEISKDEA